MKNGMTTFNSLPIPYTDVLDAGTLSPQPSDRLNASEPSSIEDGFRSSWLDNNIVQQVAGIGDGTYEYINDILQGTRWKDIVRGAQSHPEYSSTLMGVALLALCSSFGRALNRRPCVSTLVH